MNKVRVPVSLLLDPMLTVSAKVIWIVLRLYPELTRGSRPSPTRLAALTGLSPLQSARGLPDSLLQGGIPRSRSIESHSELRRKQHRVDRKGAGPQRHRYTTHLILVKGMRIMVAPQRYIPIASSGVLSGGVVDMSRSLGNSLRIDLSSLRQL